MAKKEITGEPLIPIRPILLVGANIAGKPSFMEVGAGGMVSINPPLLAVPIQHPRYTLKGIMENRTFSVDIPTAELVKEADYSGIVSGSQTDKVKDCGFTVFYGKLGTAPMIDQCPINMECTVIHILGTTSHAIVIGRVDGMYVSEEYLADGKPAFDQLNPLLWFVMKREYVGPGKMVGKPGSSGRELKKSS